MLTKKISINDMVDVYGFRVVVDSADTCYRSLGAGARLVQAHAGTLQGLHRHPAHQWLPVTAHHVVRPERRADRGADPLRARCTVSPESGIAAHWKYKTGGDTFGGVEHDRAREWLASLVQIQEGGNSEEFLESVKVDLFPDKVYVFTPKGKILRLPSGATRRSTSPTRFTPTSATAPSRPRSTGRLVPLRTPLRNGQTVDIITAKGATPNPSWSSFLVTAKARAAIRQYLKALKTGRSVRTRQAPAQPGVGRILR